MVLLIFRTIVFHEGTLDQAQNPCIIFIFLKSIYCVISAEYFYI